MKIRVGQKEKLIDGEVGGRGNNKSTRGNEKKRTKKQKIAYFHCHKRFKNGSFGILRSTIQNNLQWFIIKLRQVPV